jgi:alanine racemase
MRTTWAEIDLNAIRHNLREIRRVIHPRSAVMAVVKANAYGHGMLEITDTVLKEGVDRLAVARPEEGITLREHGITVPILIMGLTLPEQTDQIVRHNLTPAIATLDAARAISSAARRHKKTARIFIKLDTGMHRVGIYFQNALPFIEEVAKLEHISIEGVFTHFSTADARDKSYTRSQYDAFSLIVSTLDKKGLHIPIKSAANSGAVIDLPDMHLDYVRPGISLYGLSPSTEVMEKVQLQPAMQFKTRIVYLKQVPRGSKIGYGCTYTVQQDSTIATLPVGYADGYNRLLSNFGEVLVHGQRCPVIGRVCMDQIMVDVTNIPDVAIGDQVVLFGKQGDAEISIDEIAKKLNTINYEVVCSISARVQRVYLNRASGTGNREPGKE